MATGMVDQYLRHLFEVLCARPITLKFSGQSNPRDRLGSRSHQAADCHVVRFRGYAARRVGDDIYVIAVPHRVDGGHGKTHLRPECGR